MADGASCCITLRLVEYDIISAVGAFSACQLICLNVKGIAAAARYTFSAEQPCPKQTGACLGILTAVRTLYYKFTHSKLLLSYFCYLRF